jgi:hypothetical protein
MADTEVSVLGFTSMCKTLVLLEIQVVFDVMLCGWVSCSWCSESLCCLHLEPGGEGTRIPWNARNGSPCDMV